MSVGRSVKKYQCELCGRYDCRCMPPFKPKSKPLATIVDEITHKLNNATMTDLSDLGNEIGFVVGKFIDKEKIGFEREDFISGIRHGISLIDGTH